MHNLDAPLFGGQRRTDARPSRHNESTYAFLRRVAGPVWDQCRELVDGWLSAYPLEHRLSIRRRFQSGDDREFTSAFWELYLHEMFRAADWTVRIEPPVPWVSTRPDFLVTKADETFYVEARCTFQGGNETGAAALLQNVYDSLEDIDSGAFHLAVTPIRIGARMPSTKQLRRDLESWLATLDLDADDYHLVESDPERQFEWVDDDWSIRFEPMPRSAAARVTPARRALGAFLPNEASFVNDAGSLRAALSEKGSKYGKLGYPLLLAINVGGGFHDERDTEQALFGTVGWRFDFDDPGSEPTPVLTEPGYWGWPGRPAHTHVAGILIAEGMHYGRVARYAPTYWPHPDAATQVNPLSMWRVAEATDLETQYREPTEPSFAHFGLPEGWPLGEPFPRD